MFAISDLIRETIQYEDNRRISCREDWYCIGGRHSHGSLCYISVPDSNAKCKFIGVFHTIINEAKHLHNIAKEARKRL